MSITVSRIEKFSNTDSLYAVKTDEKYVVRFVEAVMRQNVREHGPVRIWNGGKLLAALCYINRGKITRRASEYDSYGVAEIDSITCRGGWGYASYDITIKDGLDMPKQELGEMSVIFWGQNFFEDEKTEGK